jgi:hypothetical protein
VRVGFARNQAEAEMVQGMLLEEGIPSMLKRTRGFDVPDYLAGGPRDILVPQAGAERARQVLDGAALEGEGMDRAARLGRADPAPGGAISPGRLALWILTALVAAFAIVWILYQATG